MPDWYCAWCGGLSSMMGHWSKGFYIDGVHYSLDDGALSCSPEFTRQIEQKYGKVVAERYRDKHPERARNERAYEQGDERYT
jgi:hypothetical protein